MCLALQWAWPWSRLRSTKRISKNSVSSTTPPSLININDIDVNDVDNIQSNYDVKLCAGRFTIVNSKSTVTAVSGQNRNQQTTSRNVLTHCSSHTHLTESVKRIWKEGTKMAEVRKTGVLSARLRSRLGHIVTYSITLQSWETLIAQDS